MSGALTYLMYHELGLEGRPTVEPDPGYVRYVVRAEAFREHLAALAREGFRAVSVGEALGRGETGPTGAGGGPGRRAVLTFDDGCETDLTVAAPLLREAGAGATFYVVSGFTGRPGYMTAAQLRELADLGFEVGSHSKTHPLLPDLSDARLRAEVFESKDELEQATGRRVAHFSCPGGRWDARVVSAAREAGYESVATSRVGANAAGADRFRLARVAVMRSTSAAEVARLCRGEGFFKRRAQDAALTFAKRALGNGAYQRFRSALLGDGRGKKDIEKEV